MFRLKELREYEAYSMSEIANKIHVSKSSYADWESRRAVIPLKHMISLANVYHVSLDYLFGLSDKLEKIFEFRTLNSSKVADQLKKFRIEKGLTQEELAHEIFISRFTLSRYETNKLLVSTSCIYELCKKYSLSVDKMLGF